jgi:hypothetical protein
LITSRSLWVPASGARVKLVFRTFRISPMSSSVRVSTRIDGRARATFLREYRAMRAFMRPPMRE